MGSARLPQKMMLDLHGKPIIQWVVERSIKSKLINKLVVAIPDTNDNDLLYDFLQTLGVSIYRGSENNLVERYYKVAALYKATDIVRICADRPLICPNEIDNLIKYSFLYVPCLITEFIDFLKYEYSIISQHHVLLQLGCFFIF